MCFGVYEILHISKLKINQEVNHKPRSVPIRIILILSNWHSPIVLCQYKNVPETAEKVAQNSAWEWGREKAAQGQLGMRMDACYQVKLEGGKWPQGNGMN